MSGDKKLVMDLQLEDGGEVLDLTYLAPLLRELDHLLELSEAGHITSESVQVHSSFESLAHIRSLLTKSNAPLPG